MASSKPASSRSKSSNGNGSRRSASSRSEDAISLLKADHREVERLFEEYQQTDDTAGKAELAQQICQELTIHAMIEEEIFYPACRREGIDDMMLDEAQVEHDGAKNLIMELEAGSPDDDFYDAKVVVLSEMIKHHVNEEEKRGGIFTKARQAGMDLDRLGKQLEKRKQELMSEAEAGDLPKPQMLSMMMQPAGIAPAE